MSVSIHEHEAVVAERDALRRQVADAMESYATQAAEIQDAWRRNEELLVQLAASQAREQQFREMLKKSGMMVDAFFPPGDTTILEAMIAKAGEVAIARALAAASAINPIYGAGAAIDAIRALPGVALEDLQ